MPDTAYTSITSQGIARAAVTIHGAQQDEQEFALTLSVIRAAGPLDTVLEIGSWKGGSLYAWSRLASQVITVTLPDRAAEPFNPHGARIIWGDSTHTGTQARVRETLAGTDPDLIWVDGGHDEDTARSDIEWALSMTRHGIIGVHDICLHNRFPDIGVHRAWNSVKHLRASVEIVRNAMTTPGTGLLLPRYPG